MAQPPSPETIRFVAQDCSLGVALVATTAQGVCALLLGDDAQALEAELRRRFPHAHFSAADDTCRSLADVALALVEADGARDGLPLDLRGTAFQQRVWAALRRIPPGRTATYAEIAHQIGAPKATRAVAGACAANPVAVAIPCHRVLRSDGALSGYRWGVDRKRALLAREGCVIL
jgi:AraC family transcriptional regulator of adaptative response/methylated-DNA-[protein]-cysteine methyltransferase